jgi:small subunit ribosomal protein S17
VKERLLKDVRSAQRGRGVSIQRLAQAKKRGLQIPSFEEAMAGLKAFEESEKARREAHGGQAGQIKTAKERRVEQGKKNKAELKAEQKVKAAKEQTL